MSAITNEEIKEFPQITTYGYVKGDKVYLKGYGGFKDRELGVVRETPEASLQYFVARFEMAEKKVQEIIDSVEVSENKGSYLMKLLHMRSYLASFNGLGDFTELYERLNELEDRIRVYIEKNRQKNYDIKSALLAEAEILKDSNDWKEATLKFKELKMKWIKTGSAHKEFEDEFSTRFDKLFKYFFDRRKQYFAEQAKIMRDRYFKYNHAVQIMRQINKAGAPLEEMERVKKLQNDFKTFGKIPLPKFKKFSIDFKKEIDTYFQMVKARKEPPKSKLQLKKEMLEAAEEFLNEGKFRNINKIKDMQLRWKEFGKLTEAEDKDLNLKFRIVCNEIFESHFLDRSAKKLFDDLYNRSDEEQDRIKIELLQSSIELDEKELRDFNFMNSARLNSMTPDFELIQQRNNYINKIKTKQRILKKLQDMQY